MIIESCRRWMPPGMVIGPRSLMPLPGQADDRSHARLSGVAPGPGVLVLVAGGGGDPGQPGRGCPYQDAGFRLFEFPALSLLDLVVPAAQGCEIAPTRDAAVLPLPGMVLVAAGRGAAAAGGDAPGTAGHDQVAQLTAGPVLRLGLRVLARTLGDWFECHAQ